MFAIYVMQGEEREEKGARGCGGDDGDGEDDGDGGGEDVGV